MVSLSRYDSGIVALVRETARAAGVPEGLGLGLAWQESRFDRWAVSRVGAMGVCQLMPDTARELGVTDAFDARQNIRGGMTYLSRMFKRFGSWDLALAAYNAGPGRVAKKRGIPQIPETQAYVAAINKFAEEYKT